MSRSLALFEVMFPSVFTAMNAVMTQEVALIDTGSVPVPMSPAR